MKNLLCYAVTLALIACLAGGQQSKEASVKTPRHDCKTEQFLCTDGSRIPLLWLCDNDADCADGSDEIPANCVINCTKDGSPFTVDCDKQVFTCNDGNTNKLSWLCDGYSDCYDGSDEKPENCKNYCPKVPTPKPARRIRKKRFLPAALLKFALFRAAATLDWMAKSQDDESSSGGEIM